MFNGNIIDVNFGTGAIAVLIQQNVGHFFLQWRRCQRLIACAVATAQIRQPVDIADSKAELTAVGQNRCGNPARIVIVVLFAVIALIGLRHH